MNKRKLFIHRKLLQWNIMMSQCHVTLNVLWRHQSMSIDICAVIYHSNSVPCIAIARMIHIHRHYSISEINTTWLLVHAWKLVFYNYIVFNILLFFKINESWSLLICVLYVVLCITIYGFLKCNILEFTLHPPPHLDQYDVNLPTLGLSITPRLMWVLSLAE